MRARRSTREMIEDRLELSGSGRLEDDLDRNYDPDVVCFARDGIHRGHDGADTFFVRDGRIVAQTSHHFLGQGPPAATRVAKRAPETLHSVEDGS